MQLPRGLLKKLIREGYSAPDAMREAWRRVRLEEDPERLAVRVQRKRHAVRRTFRGNPSSAYDVFLRGKKIDTVFQSDPSSAEEVKRSLVEHDGYDPDIRVVKKRKSLPPLFRRRRNPGAAWHREQAQVAERQVGREERAGRSGRYFRGKADAHALSAHESRKMGLNPRRIGKRQFVAVRYVTSRSTAQLRLTSGDVVDIQPHVLKRFSPDIFDLALTYPDAWVEVSGSKKNPREARTLVGRVFKAERWAKRWARGRPIRKVKGGWQILAGRKRTPAQERAHRRGKPNPRHPSSGLPKPQQGLKVQYSPANQGYVLSWHNHILRVFGSKQEAVAEFHRLLKKGTQKNPIAVYNPPPGRIIYGRVLAVEAQKTNGSHRGKRFRHSFAGESRVAAYAMPDGSVLLKSAAGKRLWADR